MRSAFALGVLIFVAAGCGQTYSVEQARGEMASRGVTTIAEHVPSRLDLFVRCGSVERGFAPLGLAIEDLSFDYSFQSAGALRFPGGGIEVLCGRYDAARFQQLVELIRAAHRGRALREVDRAFAVGHVERRGNLVLFETVRQPKIEAAFAAFH